MTDLEIIEKYGKETLPGFYKDYLIPHGPFIQIWVDVIGYDGIYKVSNYSNVYSTKRIILMKNGVKRTIESKFLEKTNDRGYLFVGLRKKKTPIARLVGIHFINNELNKPCINHIRGIKDDNLFTQLEWVTHSENTQHLYDELKFKVWHAGKIVNNKLKKPIIGISLKDGTETLFTHFRDFSDKGFTIGHVNQCVRGERKTHKKHIWKFQE